MTCESDTDYEVREAAVLVGKELPVEIDLFDFCALPWRPNEDVQETEVVRPTIPTGFAYQCLADGTTSGKEPLWPKALDGEVTDGSTSWKAVAAGTNGLNVASSPTGVSSDTGVVTVASVSIEEGRKLLATYTGVAVGEAVVTFSFTVDGKSRGVRQAVTVE